MESINSFIFNIKEKRESLYELVDSSQDSSLLRKASQSLAIYLTMERHLAQLGIFIDGFSKELIPESAYHDQLSKYLLRLSIHEAYLYQDLDWEYVQLLLNILAKKYSFSVPLLDTDNQEILHLTKQFYFENFSDSIWQEANSLLSNSYILFLESHSLNFPIPIYGRSYQDYYYEDVYSFIQKWHNLVDLSSLSHEIFHGVHFKLNSNNLFSVPESKEIGATMIEFLYYHFLSDHFMRNGDILKKISMMSASNLASILQNDLTSNAFHAYLVNSFLKIEAILIGYGMSQEYLFDKENGNQKLMKYIHHFFSTSSLPDYSFLGYTKDKILEIANMFAQERDYFLTPNYQKSL